MTSGQIAAIIATDQHAAVLVSRAKECADIYQIVTRRQKGCDGMGELAMIREEFKEALDELVSYSKKWGYLPEDYTCELDCAATELSAVP